MASFEENKIKEELYILYICESVRTPAGMPLIIGVLRQ